MKKSTLKKLVALAIIALVGINTTQILWFMRAFDAKEKQFNQTVTIALMQVSTDILRYNNHQSPTRATVSQPASNYFIVMVNDIIDANVLEPLLIREFGIRNILTDFEYGIYDCESEDMIYGKYVAMSSEGTKEQVATTMPKWDRENYYFMVHFPNMEANLIGQMGIWLFSSGVMVLVSFFFFYSLIIIFKQKRLSDIQKDFVNNMTHEFKTPVSTIAIAANVLRDTKVLESPERIQNYASIIAQEARRLQDQMERVLQMAALDGETLKINQTELHIHNLIKDAVQRIKIITQQKAEINIELNALNDRVLGDALHISNCIQNLLDNALKYSKDTPTVTVSTKDDGNRISISVSDNGIGIPASQVSKIFDRFYRVPTGYRHDVKGFGLGLFYVKEMVKAHNGAIEVESQLGIGSTFTIHLPLK